MTGTNSKFCGLPIALTLVVTIVFSGCQEAQWESAQSTNTIQAYKNFLKSYPDSSFSNEARYKLESMYFQKTIDENTIHSYRAFLDKYPQSRFAAEANRKIGQIVLGEQRELQLEVTVKNAKETLGTKFGGLDVAVFTPLNNITGFWPWFAEEHVREILKQKGITILEGNVTGRGLLVVDCTRQITPLAKAKVSYDNTGREIWLPTVSITYQGKIELSSSRQMRPLLSEKFKVEYNPRLRELKSAGGAAIFLKFPNGKVLYYSLVQGEVEKSEKMLIEELRKQMNMLLL